MSCAKACLSITTLEPKTYNDLPPRSILASLKPLGLGTPYRESLTSYFQRLADQHCVTPRQLARELVVPRLRVNNRIKQSQTDRYWKSSFFNGMGETPKAWAQILGELTSIRNLERLTLLPLHGRIGLQEISPAARRWCPHCLEEGVQSGSPYGQLLWEIGCVTACPKHGIKLVESCTCTPSDSIRPLKAKFLPHLCAQCGSSLTPNAGVQAELANAEDIQTANVVGELLGSSSYDEPCQEDQCSGIANYLEAAIRILGDGNCAKIARMLSVSKGSLSEWRDGHHLPSLPQAVRIAAIFGTPLSDLLWGRGTDRLLNLRTWTPPRRLVRGCKRRRECVENLSEKMQELLKVNPPVSITDAGELLGMHPRELRRLEPELAKALSERSSEWKEHDAAQRRKECLQVVRGLANQMASEGIIPTRKRLENRLNGELTKGFLIKERVACSRICIEARRLHLKAR